MNVDPILASVIVEPSSGASALSSCAHPERAASVEEHTPQPEKSPRQLEVDASFGANNRIIYRIVDKETQDLVLQIPPEQLLEIAKGIQEMLQPKASASRLDQRS